MHFCRQSQPLLFFLDHSIHWQDYPRLTKKKKRREEFSKTSETKIIIAIQLASWPETRKTRTNKNKTATWTRIK